MKKKRGGGGDEEDESEKRDDFKNLKDDVAFNEIVHAPPSLKAFQNVVRRPGENKGLLLARTMKGGGAVSKPAKKQKISMAKQFMLDQERDKVIKEYRRLKANAQFQ